MGCAPSKNRPADVQASEQVNKIIANATLGSGLERPKASTEEVSASPSREYSGAIKPHDEGERQLLHSLGILDAPGDPKFDSIKRLLCTVFNVPTALVSLANSDKPRLRTTPCLFLRARACPLRPPQPLLTEFLFLCAQRQRLKTAEGLEGSQATNGRPFTDAEPSFCAWALLPDHPEVLVVPNTLEDARFRENPLVQMEPHIRFYAGCPLVSSTNGLRYGLLCLIDTKPHPEFSAEQYNMLVQFAELAVREIEKEQEKPSPAAMPSVRSGLDPFDPGGARPPLPPPLHAPGDGSGPEPPITPPTSQPALPPFLQLDTLQNAVQQHITQRNSAPAMPMADSAGHNGSMAVRPPATLLQTASAPPSRRSMSLTMGDAVLEGSLGGEHARLIRATDCFKEGVALVDVSTPSWQIMYTNNAFMMASGLPQDEATAQGFWDLFYTQSLSPDDFHFAVGSGQPFTVVATLQSIYTQTPRTLVVDFRPAATARIPPTAPSSSSSSITLGPSASTTLTRLPSNAASEAASAAPSPEPSEGLFYFAILRVNRRAGSHTSDNTPEQAEVLPGAEQGVAHHGRGSGSDVSHPAGPFSDATAASASQAGSIWDRLQQPSPSGPAAAATLQRQQQLAALKQAMPSAFTDVKLGPLIGRGAYGRVYRGGWNGNIVAVKVIEYQEEVDSKGDPVGVVAHARNGIFEAVLSSSLSHPNVVHTYQYAIRRLESDDEDGRRSPSPMPSPKPSPLQSLQQQPPQQQPPQQQPPQQQPPQQQPPQQQPTQSSPPQPQQQASQQQLQQQQQQPIQQPIERLGMQQQSRLSWEPLEAASPTPPDNAPAATQQQQQQQQGAGAAGGAQSPPQGAVPGGQEQQQQQAVGQQFGSSVGGSWVLSDMGLGQSGCEGRRMVNSEVWLIQEYCNRGPLLSAVERGAFMAHSAAQFGQPNLISVLQTLQEIAAAMQYLHQNNVVHGDLTGGNVLLTTSDKDARGFTAKVVDFGLSRVCTEQYLRTRTLGCAEYMPPELITDGILTTAADVYAFGVLAWEVFVGRRAWDGLKPAEVLRKVASRARLSFPPSTPHRLKVLAERCMEYDPTARPSFKELVFELNSVLADTLGILHRFLAASTAAAAAAGGGGAAAAGLQAQQGAEKDGFPEVEEGLLPSDPFRSS